MLGPGHAKWKVIIQNPAWIYCWGCTEMLGVIENNKYRNCSGYDTHPRSNPASVKMPCLGKPVWACNIPNWVILPNTFKTLQLPSSNRYAQILLYADVAVKLVSMKWITMDPLSWDAMYLMLLFTMNMKIGCLHQIKFCCWSISYHSFKRGKIAWTR